MVSDCSRLKRHQTSGHAGLHTRSNGRGSSQESKGGNRRDRGHGHGRARQAAAGSGSGRWEVGAMKHLNGAPISEIPSSSSSSCVHVHWTPALSMECFERWMLCRYRTVCVFDRTVESSRRSMPIDRDVERAAWLARLRLLRSSDRAMSRGAPLSRNFPPWFSLSDFCTDAPECKRMGVVRPRDGL